LIHIDNNTNNKHDNKHNDNNTSNTHTNKHKNHTITHHINRKPNAINPENNAPYKNNDLVEMWRLKDELNDVQTLGAKCLKAARLRKIQRQSDFELPSVEVESLIALSNADYNCYGRLELTVNVHQFNQFNQFNLSDTVKHSRFAYKTTHKASLLHTVKSSRRKAEYIKNEMEYISTPYEKENYLMKQFIVYNFTGHQRSIAR
jgi:hypothetical protein